MRAAGEERWVWRGICAALAALALLALVAAQPRAAMAACANEAIRSEQGPLALALPDCRAFELVSPGSIASHSRAVRAAPDGSALTYFTTHPALGASSSSYFYLARRGAAGWAVVAAGPQNVPGASFEDECDQNMFFSPDLSVNVDEEGWMEPSEPARCKRNETVFVPGEPNPARNVLLHDWSDGSFQLINQTPAGVVAANAKFQDASDDFSQIFFAEEATLTPDSPSGSYNFYVWRDGVVRLLTVLPDGSPVAGELVEAAGHRLLLGGSVEGSGLAPATGAVSADGDRAFFYAEGNLYLRQNPSQPQSPLLAGSCTDPALACTVQIDASQGPGSGGGGIFWRASEDGSKVLFTSAGKLTPDATAAPGKADLYEYDVETGTLTDLTVSVGAAADVRGVSGASADLSRVYFVANGALAPGAAPGDCAPTFATEETCNLYLAEGGTIAFVATLSGQDSESWQESAQLPRKPRSVLASASSNGGHLAFVSIRSLTGYDNEDPQFPGSFHREIFHYETGSGDLACVSCPSGPTHDWGLTVRFAGNYSSSTPGGAAQWPTPSVLNDGSVFFDTEDPLLPADVNQSKDVYRYRGGELRLLSGGNFAGPSRFRVATPSGSDVFISTSQSLVATDTDRENTSLYDLRIGGGFPTPAPPAPGCEGDGCRPLPPGVADPPPPGSATLLGKKAKKRCKPHRHCRRCKRVRHCGKHRHAGNHRRHRGEGRG